MWRRITLRGKLTLVGIALQVLGLGFLTLSSTRILDRYLGQELEIRAQQMKSLLSAALAAPMAQKDYASVEAILQESGSSLGIVHLSVRDVGERLIAQVGPGSPGMARHSPEQKQEQTLAMFSAPLALAGQHLGTINFSLSRDSLEQALDQIIMQLLVIGALTLGTFTVLLWLASSALTRPLKRLIVASREIRAGNYDIDLAQGHGDDISGLMRAFRKMNEEIRRRIADLTESERLQRRYLQESLSKQADIEAALTQAQSATRAKSEFLANMSHEIRTPMNAVLGFAQLLQATPLRAEQASHLEQMVKAGNSLLRILNDILDYSKIEAGHLELTHEALNLSDLFTSVADLFSYQASQKGLHLHTSLAPDVPSRLRGDPLRLRQILINLVGNALKFTDQGGVRVEACRLTRAGQPDRLRLSVSDTGIGMSPDQSQQVFSAFAQADNSITRRFGGTGLGLAICSRLVQLMQGEISVRSALGQGTTFFVDLPLEPDRSAATVSPVADTAAIASVTSRLKGARVLLVEDNPVNTLLARSFLLELGLEVCCASNGQEGLELARLQAFDVILMDLQMPVLDGFEATRKIRQELGPDCPPIIAVSASALLQDQQACLQAGMSDHLAKPILRDRLGAILLKWVDLTQVEQIRNNP